MAALRVLVCDDQEPDAVEDAIREGGPDLHENRIEAPNRTDLEGIIREFFGNVTTFLRGDESVLSEEGSVKSGFDDFDIIFLDNNLSSLEVGGVRLTAEFIAGYIRAFSRTPYVVSLNRNVFDFDLRFLVGDFETKADLSLKTEHLKNVALWKHPEAGTEAIFRPWYWPNLSNAPGRRRSQVESLLTRLNEPILSYFAFPGRAKISLSRHATAYLSPQASIEDLTGGEGTPIEDVTFWHHFRTSNRTLLRDERAELCFPGLAPVERAARMLDANEPVPGDERLRAIVSRVVAGEIEFWLRRDVIGPQDVLIDAPHLAMRLPVLLGSAGGIIDDWNKIVNSRTPPHGMDADLFDRFVRPWTFEAPIWVNTPTFWWPEIEAAGDLQILAGEDEVERVRCAFAEDTSRFVPRDAEGVAGFVSEAGQPWNPRFVERPGQEVYAPLSQFAL
ncbi:MAG: hypothetical protein ACK4SZ_13850 [Allosphingosinicella sp.]|uniref:hypothetical protein n=1 Tax=Allosphingosinicella sp. TaxID=2823234 RepID=UPI00393256C2